MFDVSFQRKQIHKLLRIIWFLNKEYVQMMNHHFIITIRSWNCWTVELCVEVKMKKIIYLKKRPSKLIVIKCERAVSFKKDHVWIDFWTEQFKFYPQKPQHCMGHLSSFTNCNNCFPMIYADDWHPHCVMTNGHFLTTLNTFRSVFSLFLYSHQMLFGSKSCLCRLSFFLAWDAWTSMVGELWTSISLLLFLFCGITLE